MDGHLDIMLIEDQQSREFLNHDLPNFLLSVNIFVLFYRMSCIPDISALMSHWLILQLTRSRSHFRFVIGSLCIMSICNFSYFPP